MKLVDTVFITDYINIIQARSYLMLTKHDVECHICFRQPGIILDPVIFFCILLMIFKHLFKQSE